MLVELISKNAGQTQEKRGAYYPRPSAVGHCIRSLVYHATDVPADRFPDRTILVFDDGNWHEELLKDHIRKTVFQLDELKGPRQRIHIAIIGDKKMDGEIDGLITDPLNTTRLLEIKSINHFGFERLKDGPLDEHRRQANLYLHGLILGGLEVREALILYKNKNTAAMKEFIIAYDEAQALSDIDMFKYVEDAVQDGEIPPRPYAIDDWHCQYCRWQKHCWEGYAGEVAALSKDVALSEEIETAARYYNELGAQKSEIEKERDGIGETLRRALSDAQAQSGRAGEYLLTLSVGERKKIDESLVPPQAITKIPSERFTVKRIKVKEKAL
jgi:CRISPR/Cas system-associated exonuclease Cas4 (RecB family)